MVGCPLGLLQLVIYCKYRKGGIAEKPNKWDIEKNINDKTKELQPVTNGQINSNAKLDTSHH